MIANLLTKLEEEKDQWIFKAIDHFNEGFLRFDGQKFEKDQVLIGVYGPTHVGKTAFILTILGIGGEHISPLFHALGGKYEKGNSSAITSFIYKRSDDENFYLIFPDKTTIGCANIEELETAMETIRMQIEGGQISYDKPIILRIARQFFTNTKFAAKSKTISIIDLPGNDLIEKQAEAYVEQILTAYMPLCSACLVMENLFEIDRLFQLDGSRIKDWMHDCRNYVLVITRVLQSASVKNAIESGDIASLEDFRSYYQGQLNRNEGGIQNKIFPLEFGEAWLELKQQNSPVDQKAKEWIEQLFLELLDVLTAVRTPENKILQMKDIEHSIQKQRNLELEAMEKEIKLLEESLQADQQHYQNLISAGQSLQQELEIYEADQAYLDRVRIKEFTCHLDGKFAFDDKKDQVVFKDRKKSKLMRSFQMAEMEMLEFYKRQITESSLSLSKLLKKYTLSVTMDFQTDPPTADLSLKHGRVLDQYLKRGNFEEDYSIVLDTLEKTNMIVYHYYFSQLHQFKETCNRELIQLWNTKKEHIRLLDKQLKEKHEQKSKKEAGILALQDKRDRAKQDWNLGLKGSLLLDEILKEEFVKAVEGWQEKLFSIQATDAERWVYHHYCQMILKQAERIIGNDYF